MLHRRGRLPETKDEGRPYRYVRTFKEVEMPRPVAEMDRDEVQGFINQLLGAKGVDNAITKTKPSQPSLA